MVSIRLFFCYKEERQPCSHSGALLITILYMWLPYQQINANKINLFVSFLWVIY